ncbi:MAG: LytTR family DNA-binding domain-containing protein [Burkholderiaceae bacterium]|nr:LytTR family DNA-binding domain-containing protein [Burkholderiaceae bacterium]
MPTALIADDEPHLAEYLRGKLAALWPELQIVATAANGPQAAEAIRRLAPDIAFLDIRMPGATGLEVAEGLRGAARVPRVVFVTAYDEYAVKAFEADAIDYLLKPVNDERLARTLDKLRAAIGKAEAAPAPEAMQALLAQLSQHLASAPRQHLRWLRASKKSGDGEVTEQIAVADVVYIQADDKYTCIHAGERGRDGSRELREWLIRVPLTELSQQLDPADFAQIHRSVIVNLHAVAGTRRDLTGKLYVRLRDYARELPVARQYVGLFRQM